ncbi:MAG: hypothetical protein EAZ89_15125, partial [Bacteroidetes bacterium]
SFKSLTILFVLLVALLTGAAAQTPDSTQTDPKDVAREKRDTTEIDFKNKKLIIITDAEGKHIEIKDSEDVLSDDEDEDAEENEDSESGENDEDSWDDYDPDHDHKEKSKRPRSEVGGIAFDLGITNYFVNGTYGTDAAVPQLALRDFRPGGHVALHLLPTRVSLIGRGAVNLKSAITIDFSNYYFTNDVTLVPEQNTLTFDTTGIDFTRNKLVSRYAQIPLLLNFNTSPGSDDGVSISVGGYAGLLWGAYTKQVSDEVGKVKVKDDYNLNPFRYGLTARIDFKWFDFYANYNLTGMFKEGEGPETQTFTAGINFINF